MRKVLLLLTLAAGVAFAQTASYPSAVVTDNQLRVAANNIQTTLTFPMLSSDTTINVVNATGITANSVVTIDNEKTAICNVVGNQLSVGKSSCPNVDGRGFDSTAAAAHANGAGISLNIDAWHHNAMKAEVEAIEAALGINLANITALIPNPTPVNKGGTGATTQAGARSALGAAESGANSSITSLTGLLTPLPATEGGTGTASVTGILIGSGTNPFAGVTGTPLQQLRVKPNVAGTVYEFASTPALNPVDYNFPAQTPGGTLAAGANTITMTPCPLGVNGSDVGHRYSIQGGVGTAEAGLSTGGTCTSGAASGTLILTLANTHSGAWTIQSATVGGQEAAQAACTAGGTAVRVPAGAYTWVARLALPCSLSFRGAGLQATTITMATGYTGRAVEAITPSGGYVDFGSLSINYTTNGTSGEGLYLQEVTDGVISDLAIINSADGITGQGIGRVYFDHISLFPRRNGYNFSSNLASGVIGVAVPVITNTYLTMQSGVGAGVLLAPTTAGVIIDNLNQGLGAAGVEVVQSSGSTNEFIVANSIIDSVSAAAIFVSLSGTATMSRISIDGNMISNVAGGALGILLQSATTGNIGNARVLNNSILFANAAGTGISLQGVSGGVISGNLVNTNNAGGTGILLDGTANTDLKISGNLLGLGTVYTPANGSGFGIFINSQAHTRIDITGNTLVGSTATLSNASTVAGGVRWSDNKGIDDVVPTVASAATLAFPINPTFFLSGTTAVTAVAVPNAAGSKFTMIATSATPGAWTAGATIGNTFTPTQNVPVSCMWDGTKIWCKP